jgi:uncharacterized protein YbjT (DUF2867 family)/mannose-6-phosphate isomerase-like protein (cupin superfamily)
VVRVDLHNASLARTLFLIVHSHEEIVLTDISIVAPDGGDRVLTGPAGIRIIEDGSTTDHRLAVGIISLAPHTDGPPQHWHERHDEGFYVLSGTATFSMGEEHRDVPAGGFVMVPPKAIHTFANRTDEPVEILNTFTPDLYVQYFRESRDRIAAGAPLTPQSILEVMANYHTYPAGSAAPDAAGSLAMSHLVLLGGSGRTGGHVIDDALSRGHTVTALVRDPEKLGHRDGLSVTTGTPVNAADVARAMPGADAVVVTLNSSRTSDLPWARPVSPPRLMADSVANATQAMTERGIRRIVIVSAFGAGDSLARQPLLTRWTIQHTNLSYTYADHNLVDAEIRTTDTDWTLLRPVALNDKPATGNIAVTELDGPRPSFFISRADVARFAIDSLDDVTYIHRAPIISQDKRRR